MRRSLWLLLTATRLLAAAPTAVALPPGETRLDELGIYQVGYQSYGHEPVLMPESWSGHFETLTGISYWPDQTVLGRRCLLLHSPWRVPPGRAWAEYSLALPAVKPLSLSFGISMLPDVMVPGKSDGVTFSAYANDQELLRLHYATPAWRDFNFDLSRFAGQTVTLRLQVEPGPANNASFDYSYFGDPKVIVGNAATNVAAQVDALLASKAVQAVDTASLEALANRGDRGVVPSNLLACRNRVERDGDSYVFRYDADDCGLAYRWTPTTGTLDDVTVQVDNGRVLKPGLGGGLLLIKHVRATGGQASNVRVAADNVTLDWEYPGGARATWRLGIVGKALTVTVDAPKPEFGGLTLGSLGGATLRREFTVPYLEGTFAHAVLERLFCGRFLDWTVSNSSSCPRGTATYEPKTDGTRNPLHEVGYLSVSPCVDEVLPNLPHPASPFLDLLGPKIMLDIWGHHRGTYAGDAENLRELKDNGVDHLAIIDHVWQRWGYDVKLPDHLPADPHFGGDEGLKRFGQAANECGYVWSVHENYIDLYPDAPSYDPSARVLRADGSPSPAWFNSGTKVQSYGLKCNRALGYAKQNAPEIHRRFNTNAGYLDVHTCVPPWHQLDHQADQPGAAMARYKLGTEIELFQFMRNTHRGPMFGEGHHQFYWAGRADGVEAQVQGGEDHRPLLDFDLLKLHPQMVNHGMGYYERWFRRGYQHQLGVDTGTPEQIDKYRAQELAYGHAGFVGASQTDNLQWVAKEHHLVHAVTRLSGNAKVTDVRYEVAGRLVPTSVALAVGDTSRQRIRYTSGLTVWVNWSPQPWSVEGRTLPQWGWLALGPRTEAGLSLRDGRPADFADCPDYVFADARTSFNMPYRHARVNVEPRLRSFKWLGGGKAEVTYEWKVGQTLDQDYHCFVHGVAAHEEQEGIVFQGDHALPKPTNTWQPGETIVDGPYTLNIPDAHDQYDLTIGLYKGERVPLKGPSSGGQRILLAHLKLEKADGQVTAVTADSAPEHLAAASTPTADFDKGLNPPGTYLDFGLLATDGSVKVQREGGRLVVLPYPRNRVFTVALDLSRLTGQAIDPRRARVSARAALTQAELGAVPTFIEGARVGFKAGLNGAGRFVVTW